MSHWNALNTYVRTYGRTGQPRGAPNSTENTKIKKQKGKIDLIPWCSWIRNDKNFNERINAFYLTYDTPLVAGAKRMVRPARQFLAADLHIVAPPTNTATKATPY